MVVLASVRLLVKVPTVEMWACSKVDLGFGLVFTVLTPPFLVLSRSGLGGLCDPQYVVNFVVTLK